MDVERAQQQAIDEFLSIIHRKKPIPERIADQVSGHGTPVVTNKYRVQGLKAQKGAEQKETSTQSLVPILVHDLREARLHEKIVEHPFLLHTPELYMGELLLDAVVDEFRLPSGHRPDFIYLSGHNQVMRITLVEIERASGQVFSKRSRHAAFHGDTQAGIDQIEEWKEKLKSEDRQKALLLSLKPMLDSYPIPLFTPNENVAKDTRIEIGYVLIVGNEEVVTEEQQGLIDALYLNQQILFMTYPMMVDQVVKHRRQKHMIKILTRSVHVKSQAAELPPFKDKSGDPLGVKMAGLGVSHVRTSTKGDCFYPEAIREIFFRSAGKCEMTGCSEQIVKAGQLCGHFTPIYNYYPEQSKLPFTEFLRQKYTALLCDHHRGTINEGEISPLGAPHPLSHKLTFRRPYSPDLDSQLMEFMSLWMGKVSNGIISKLDFSEGTDDSLVNDLRMWTRALISLPNIIRPSFERIVRDCFAKARYHRIDRSVAACQRDGAFHYLMKAGLLRVNLAAPVREQVEPTILTSDLIDMVHERAGPYAIFAISDLCSGDGYNLARQFSRVKGTA